MLERLEGNRVLHLAAGHHHMIHSLQLQERKARQETLLRRLLESSAFSVAERLSRLRQRVGMLFQFPEAQLFERTVFADVAFGPQRMNLSRKEIRKRVIAALDMAGLPHHEFLPRSPFQLSGGQMRRVALAGVLAMSPTVLILDEPTVGLDASGRAEFYSYLQRIKEEQGVTIVLVSHDMAEVAMLADWLFVLHNGHLVMQGMTRSIFTQGNALREWGLAAPPLSELLRLVRQKGVSIPDDIFTLEEAFTLLKDKSQAHWMR